jgi:hypothetical protein
MDCPHWLLALAIPFSRSDRACAVDGVGAGLLRRTVPDRRRQRTAGKSPSGCRSDLERPFRREDNCSRLRARASTSARSKSSPGPSPGRLLRTGYRSPRRLTRMPLWAGRTSPGPTAPAAPPLDSLRRDIRRWRAGRPAEHPARHPVSERSTSFPPPVPSPTGTWGGRAPPVASSIYRSRPVRPRASCARPVAPA